MAEFMSAREPAPAERSSLIDGNDGPIPMAHDPGFSTLKWLVEDRRPAMLSNGLDFDLLGLSDAQLIEECSRRLGEGGHATVQCQKASRTRPTRRALPTAQGNSGYPHR